MPATSRLASGFSARRHAVALSAATALVVTFSPGCAPSPSPQANAANPGRQIDVRTPPGIRAQQTLDMLDSDWPIGPVGVGTLAAPDMVKPVQTTMEALWWDRPFTLNGVDLGASVATLHLTSSYGARQDIRIHTDDGGWVDRFDLETQAPKINSWHDIDAVLSKTGARYSYQVAKVDNGHCDPVAGTNTGESLPLASIFKLYVLHALAGAIKDGTVSWDDQLTVTDKSRAVGSSGLQLPAGAHVSVRTAAEKMIATSDNMATDLLIGKMGTHAIEEALATANHHDPASMTPFPTMYELFSVGWGKPDLRSQWQHGSPQVRAQLLEQANSTPYEPDPIRAHTPASSYGAEWYGNAEDICRIHAALQADAVGKAAPVRQILSAVAGIQLDRTVWPYIGAKAGGLPGDLTFSWYAVDKTQQPYVVSFQLNWPRDHGPTVTAWMLQVAKQAFALIAPR
ncbi:serine hydrolase [Mycobacterium nebraskense]|uniref:Serine hydrolase n=1 Tax=Mycobacterium nebraskense TaxID=244292 RepID=A0A1X1YX02_9MYCO|nr:serine hydrolase [Mycobacterium nebraskense]KKC04276.1 beta-lactamase [Mycobacterium nebraskense]MBI2693164.1 class A beta-lactamase-related serine hydrolase [Mycobacterium nebraskense]MCV7120986.1 class A beta-lactamase-related serine hydrolase [Mycobacterium nebraskense]ORW15619.1 serine hydrolase [Mycobacterium nebraskense]